MPAEASWTKPLRPDSSAPMAVVTMPSTVTGVPSARALASATESGEAVGSGVVSGVGLGVGSGVGLGVGSGVGLGVGSGVELGVGSGVELGAGGGGWGGVGVSLRFGLPGS